METVKSILQLLLTSINLLFATLLLAACLAPFISPEWSWLFAFPGLAFPGIVLANVFWIFFWLIFKKCYMLISGIALVLSAWNISNQIGWKTCHAVDAPDNSFSVMSFNVKVFDLYSWTQNAESKNYILQIIKNPDPDILCIQEFYSDSEKFNTVKELKERYPYYHFHKTLTIEKTHHWGIATFSKFPIVAKENIPFQNSMHNACIATDVLIGDDTVRIFNTHLQSIYFNEKDYAEVKDLMEQQLEKVSLGKSFNKLKTAFVKRAAQADLLHEKIEACPYKTIVCGDFNDTPNSYAYHQISKGLDDSFLEGGCGFGFTYTAPYPFLRIDYVLPDPRIKTLAHKTQWNQSSDHFAAYGLFEKP
ncbi:MAG: endonuclease/exonuclease/phosphatase family protein [Chitinophagales bacterium]|nr:endonuclease/exonuclease/phosphatase family protein [Chitinophagales bacterium]